MSPENLELHRIVKLNLRTGRSLRVLEAGCGSTSHLPLDPSWHLTGIDLSQRQLDNNPHLQVKVLGNLETHDWGLDQFDLIVCWDVIEHLPNPQKALLSLMSSLCAGGLLVLAFPNLHSIKGYITKLTPFWVHIAFYRFLLGQPRSVAEGNQFPTYLRRDILPKRVKALAEANNIECCYELCYEGPVQRDLRKRSAIANVFFAAIQRLNLNGSDCMLVLRRPIDAEHKGNA